MLAPFESRRPHLRGILDSPQEEPLRLSCKAMKIHSIGVANPEGIFFKKMYSQWGSVPGDTPPPPRIRQCWGSRVHLVFSDISPQIGSTKLILKLNVFCMLPWLLRSYVYSVLQNSLWWIAEDSQCYLIGPNTVFSDDLKFSHLNQLWLIPGEKSMLWL